MNYSLPSYLPESIQANWPILVIVLIWSLVWKGMALWKAAKRNDKRWFVALLVINTLGILEIAYIYIFSKRGSNSEGASA